MSAQQKAVILATPTPTPDVWQQLQQFRLGGHFTKLVELLVKIPGSRGFDDVPRTSPPHPVPTGEHSYNTGRQQPQLVAPVGGGFPPPAENMQLFGLFASRYFLVALVVGFIISRIQILVRRQRVRPLRPLVRIALYFPCQILLLRAAAAMCIAVARTRTPGAPEWMAGPISTAAHLCQQYFGKAQSDTITMDGAMWLVFVTICIFDCMEIFVSRLEGSPCAPYENIGNLLERTSLYYFYGGSVRIQELALLNVLEKTVICQLLISLSSGWQWRLVPTGVIDLLMMDHFVFSMRHASALKLYPFVQVLTMLLLCGAVLIVVVTVLIRSMARAVDRFGILRQGTVQGDRQAAEALYDQHGAFMAPELDDMAELADGQALIEDTYLPLCPDLRRDFGVEILDLAGTCLKQYSNQIRASGYSRSCGAIRLPRGTALDEYVAQQVSAARSRASSPVGQVGSGQRAGMRSGFAVFIENEPGVSFEVPEGPMDMAVFLKDTRVDSLRKLSLALWSLFMAVVEVSFGWRKGTRYHMSVGTGSSRFTDSTMLQSKSMTTVNSGLRSWDIDDDEVAARDDIESELDFDYVDDSSENAADEDEDDDGDGETTELEDEQVTADELINETAGLVSDLIESSAETSSRDQMSSLLILLAHSLTSTPSAANEAGNMMMTRSRYGRRLGSPALSATAVQQMPNLPFSTPELNTLVQIIKTRRQNEAEANDDNDDDSANRGNMLCVICWTNTRCVMLRPCRCLCLCNECRMSLAARSFEHCPCCRRDVVGYSRVYAV